MLRAALQIQGHDESVMSGLWYLHIMWCGVIKASILLRRADGNIRNTPIGAGELSEDAYRRPGEVR